MLKKIRKEHRYNQQFISEYLGITQSVYSRIESGDYNLPTKHAMKLGKLYHIDWWKLYEGSTDEDEVGKL